MAKQLEHPLLRGFQLLCDGEEGGLYGRASYWFRYWYNKCEGRCL